MSGGWRLPTWDSVCELCQQLENVVEHAHLIRSKGRNLQVTRNLSTLAPSPPSRRFVSQTGKVVAQHVGAYRLEFHGDSYGSERFYYFSLITHKGINVTLTSREIQKPIQDLLTHSLQQLLSI